MEILLIALLVLAMICFPVLIPIVVIVAIVMALGPLGWLIVIPTAIGIVIALGIESLSGLANKPTGEPISKFGILWKAGSPERQREFDAALAKKRAKQRIYRRAQLRRLIRLPKLLFSEKPNKGG